MNRAPEGSEPPPVPPHDPFPAPPSTPRPEVPEPPQEHRRRAVVVLVGGLVAVGVASGFGVAKILDRGPCEGAGFTSTSFGYCVEPPEGWVASPASQEENGIDVFRNQDGATVVAVHAVTSDSASLQDFADQVRQLDSLQGYALGDATGGILDGAATLEWQVRVSTEGREILVREIVVIREGTAWRVQISDIEHATPDGVREAGQLVDSWRFVS